MKPLYVSFFTNAYAEDANALVQTLEAHHLAYHVERVNQFGGWLEMIQHKAAFLMHRRAKQPDTPLVWVDADARIRQHPALFDNPACDFAAHWRAGVEMLGGTMYFAPTPTANSLLRQWRDTMAGSSQLDQQDLQRIIRDSKTPFPEGLWARPDGLIVRNLPASYTAIFDFDMCPESEWVISHHQASRRLKSIVNT